MNETAISWTKHTSNPIRFRILETGKVGWHCEKISEGCKNCYAETLNMKWGTKVRFAVNETQLMEAFFDDKMAGKLYTIKGESMVFGFDMTDVFGAFIPDHIRAAAWCVILDLSQHIFQLLTKRIESAVLWHERFRAAIQSSEFKALVANVKHPKVKAALERDWSDADVWTKHIWMGASVEDAKATRRIDTLRQVPAKIRFLSCEPLLSALGEVNLSNIHWVICGGESGQHLTDPSHPRWMKMEWARELRDNCVKQGVAFFYKQDSGKVTEQRPFLVEADGSRWRWWQFPDNHIAPVAVDAKGLPIAIVADKPLDTLANAAPVATQEKPADKPYTAYDEPHLYDNDWPIPLYVTPVPLLPSPDDDPTLAWVKQVNETARRMDTDFLANGRRASTMGAVPEVIDAAITQIMKPRNDEFVKLASGGTLNNVEELMATKPTTSVKPHGVKISVANFQDVKDHWDKQAKQWDDPKYIYVGRSNVAYNMPQSPFANIFRIEQDTQLARGEAIAKFREWFEKQPALRNQLLNLIRAHEGGEVIFVCWCSPKACHAEVLADVARELLGEKKEPELKQLSLFEMPSARRFD